MPLPNQSKAQCCRVEFNLAGHTCGRDLGHEGDHRVVLLPEQQHVADWLEVLHNEKHPGSLREEAAMRLATAFIDRDTQIAALVKDLEELRKENGSLREYRRAVAALTLQTVGMGPTVRTADAPASPPRLSIVPKGGS